MKKQLGPESIGDIIINGELNTATGEYWFTVAHENQRKITRNKCLYDALSDFGIDYDSAKAIVSNYKTSSDTVCKIHTWSTDYYKHIPHTKLAHRSKY